MWISVIVCGSAAPACAIFVQQSNVMQGFRPGGRCEGDHDNSDTMAPRGLTRGFVFGGAKRAGGVMYTHTPHTTHTYIHTYIHVCVRA